MNPRAICLSIAVSISGLLLGRAQYLQANNVLMDTEVKFFADFFDLNGDSFSFPPELNQKR